MEEVKINVKMFRLNLTSIIILSPCITSANEIVLAWLSIASLNDCE